MKRLTSAVMLMAVMISCSKSKNNDLVYFEVGTNPSAANWRDTSFIIATDNPELITAARAELLLPVSERKIVNGALEEGNGGYNVNAGHAFKWHFRESDWNLTDFSIEIYDGRPFSDVDQDLRYWVDTVGRFAPWSGHISRELRK